MKVKIYIKTIFEKEFIWGIYVKKKVDKVKKADEVKKVELLNIINFVLLLMNLLFYSF